jgi:hypothetical protein
MAQRNLDCNRLSTLKRYPHVLRSVVLNQCRLGQRKHRQEELSFGIVPVYFNIRGTEGDAERLVDASPWVTLHTFFAINPHTEMTGTVHAPAALIALKGPLQEGHRCLAERSRGKAVAYSWEGATANRWDTILVTRVIQLHVTPLGKSWLDA